MSFDCQAVDSLLHNTEVYKSVGIEMTISNHKYTLVGDYRRPSSSLSAFKSSFPSVLTNLNNNVGILCDFNVDLCARSYLSSVNDFIDMFVCYCYGSLINNPTRVTKDS